MKDFLNRPLLKNAEGDDDKQESAVPPENPELPFVVCTPDSGVEDANGSQPGPTIALAADADNFQREEPFRISTRARSTESRSSRSEPHTRALRRQQSLEHLGSSPASATNCQQSPEKRIRGFRRSSRPTAYASVCGGATDLEYQSDTVTYGQRSPLRSADFGQGGDGVARRRVASKTDAPRPRGTVKHIKSARTAKKRADIQAATREYIEKAAGKIWACCIASEVDLDKIFQSGQAPLQAFQGLVAQKANEMTEVNCGLDEEDQITHNSRILHSLEESSPPSYCVEVMSGQIIIEGTYSEVLICKAFRSKPCFIFRFGCIVGWDFTLHEQLTIKSLLSQYLQEPLLKSEEDDMYYVYGAQVDDDKHPKVNIEGSEAKRNHERGKTPMIRRDRIAIVTVEPFEKLAYSYAFAQSCKLAVFEMVVDDTILAAKELPEGLAATGKIGSNREDLSRRMGELFINRFYINLHTDILDTPDIFWEFDEFAEHYTCCRSYLEIPNRVEILNQRLDIIKDLYDMLNNELTIQHGYKLEWIVIYLICVEVVIEVVWNIIIRDILKLV